MKESVDTEKQRQERVKARWAMLRQALLGPSSGTPPTSADDAVGRKNTDGRGPSTNEHSMNSFRGFGVLDRSILHGADIPKGIHTNDDEEKSTESKKNEDGWDIVRNSYTSEKGHNIQFLTREVKQQNQIQTLPSQTSSMKERVEALLSHRNHGVDNTGNVRVWDAEATLAGFLLSLLFDDEDVRDFEEKNVEGFKNNSCLKELRHDLRTILLASKSDSECEGHDSECNLLELGAGQAGLAGLALVAASTACYSHCAEHAERISAGGSSKMKALHVVLTDGHPKCVGNNDVCVKMIAKWSHQQNIPKNGHLPRVSTQLLLWDSSQKGADACKRMNSLIAQNLKNQKGNEAIHISDPINGISVDSGMYRLCLASDCVHFQEFHDGLFLTIARTLSVGGIALLCQPKRGSSLKNFMNLVDAVNNNNQSRCDNIQSTLHNSGNRDSKSPLFQMTLMDDFHPKVSKVHRALLIDSEKSNDATSYDPNWHRPLLLVLNKIRFFDEDVDGECAENHVKTRLQ